jgi:arylsulfatase A-like enzyme
MYDPESIREAFRSPEELEKFSPCTLRRASYWKGVDDELRRSFIARYLGSITLLDDLIGNVLTFLEENHLKENTLVVFTSDHGDNLGDHHMQQKGNFHDCSSKVPLIFRGPGIAAQRRIQNNVSLVDLMSTFLDYSNLLMPGHRNAAGQPIYNQGLPTSGTNLMPLLKPDAPADSFDTLSNRVVIAETGTFGYGVMLKQGNTKINHYPHSNHWDWFETADDPNELNNMGGRERPPLSPEMEVTLDRVLQGMRRHEGGSYYYEKVRPMFT